MQSTMSNYALSEPTSDDLHDYDVISAGHFSPESSIADLGHWQNSAVQELPPTQAAKDAFETLIYSSDQIQDYVSKSIDGSTAIKSPFILERAVRVYVDGMFDVIHAGDVLQLRQAKLSFPSVHLMVGAFLDADCKQHGIHPSVPHVERCELLRHCRLVDEVICDAPLVINDRFITKHRIDYVAIEEGSSVDPSVDKARLAGYDFVKGSGKAIPTRKTRGLAGPSLMQKLGCRPSAQVSRSGTPSIVKTDSPPL